MKIPLSWLRDFVDLPETPDEIRLILDDLGLVVEGIEHVGEGLGDVVVARIDQIDAIEGADRVRLVTVEAGDGPLQIVCGATNFSLGDHVPLAPIGAVLPGDFVITERKMRGVVSNGMLCSARELALSDDHVGLMILGDGVTPGTPLMNALGMSPDVIFDLSVEGNRPDAWCVEGVARDLAVRLGRPLRPVSIATLPDSDTPGEMATAANLAPDLCGRLTVTRLDQVEVGPSPSWIAARVSAAGMRPINNVVDASNYVMLELGQPTHPYDTAHVAGATLSVRHARDGESLVTLDGTSRSLAKAGRGLGDTGVDCVIVDGDDTVIGLAGIMGGESSEIRESTTSLLLESATFDAMTIARSSKRHGLRSEASSRFERGVDPTLQLRATARFIEILRASCPSLVVAGAPLDIGGSVTPPSVVTLREHDVPRTLGVAIERDTVRRILNGLRFDVVEEGNDLVVTAPPSRPDIRAGSAGRADIIEEIARVYSYRELPRRTPTWPQPGGLTARQRLRRNLRDTLVARGLCEVWTAEMVSEANFSLLTPTSPAVRLTNPLSADESLLRNTLITGVVDAWARNDERGLGAGVWGEFGHIFHHPDVDGGRTTRGGYGGAVALTLPREEERVTVVMSRPDDDATVAVAWWHALARHLGVADVVVRDAPAPAGFHPTRCAALTDRHSGAVLGYVGEVDPSLAQSIRGGDAPRLGLLDLSIDVLADEKLTARRTHSVRVPTKFPSARLDLALVVPDDVHSADVALALTNAHESVERVALFDVYRGTGVTAGCRSLAYAIRLSSPTQTLSDAEITATRDALLAAAATLGATLRG
jgi:phenylalanyl-tRNA synthetase beta chain